MRAMKDSGIPWIGEIPKDWEVVRNKNVFDNSKTLVGELWNSTQLLSLTTKGIKAVSIGSTSGKVPDSYETYQVVEKDNLVMCLFDLDCSAVFSGLSPFQGMISPAYKVLTIKDGYFPAFYDKWFNYIFDGRKFMFLSKNIRYSLTYDEFASLQIVKPSLAEQQRIAEFLDRKCAEVDEMIGLQEQIIEELKAYKQSVITEAVTKGLNPAAPMRDSEIPWIKEIPAHWEVHRGKNVLVLEKRPIRDDDDVVTCFRDGEVILRSLRRTEGFTMSDKEIGYQGINEGDIVIHGMDGFAGAMGVSKSTGKGSPVLVVCTPKYDAVPQYIVYYLRALAIMDVFVSLATGIRERSCDLRWNKISELSFIIPSPTEQQAIADYLDDKCADIDSLIQTKQSKIDSLKEYKKSIIYEYVTGKREVEL